jgi:hypothetical protein
MLSIQHTNHEISDLVDTIIFSTPPECSSLASSSQCPSREDSSDSSSCSSTFSSVEEEEALVGIARSPWETATDEDRNPGFFFSMTPPNKVESQRQQQQSNGTKSVKKNSLCYGTSSDDEEDSDVSTTEVDDDSYDMYHSDEEDSSLTETFSNAFSLPLEEDEGRIAPKTTRTHFVSLLSPLGLTPIEEQPDENKEPVVKLRVSPESLVQIENSLCCGTFSYEEEESDVSTTEGDDDSDDIHDSDEEAFSLPFEEYEGKIVSKTTRTYFVSLLSPLGVAPIQEEEEVECDDEEDPDDHKEPVVKLQENAEVLHPIESSTHSLRSVVHVGGCLKTLTPTISPLSSEKSCSSAYLAPTKDSLAWFQAKREKWRSSPRAKLLKMSDVVVPSTQISPVPSARVSTAPVTSAAPTCQHETSATPQQTTTKLPPLVREAYKPRIVLVYKDPVARRQEATMDCVLPLACFLP